MAGAVAQSSRRTRFGLGDCANLPRLSSMNTRNNATLADQPDDLVQGQRFTALAYVSPNLSRENLPDGSHLVSTSGEGAANAQLIFATSTALWRRFESHSAPRTQI